MGDRFALISELIAEPALAGRSGDVAQAVLRAESLADLPPWLLGVIIDRERYPGQPREENGEFASGDGNAGGSDDTLPFVLPGNVPGTPTHRPPKPLDWRKSETYAKVSAGALPDKVPDPREGDPLLVSLAHEVGAAGPPTLVTRDEMDRIVEAGGTPYYRGLKEVDHATQLRSGDYHGGLGVNGSGYYFTSSPATATMYAGVAWSIGDEEMGGVVVRAALKPDARVISREEASRAVYAEAQVADPHGDEADLAIANNPGRWALLHGYDAIDLGRDLIVVNRTALIVQVADPEFDREMERVRTSYPGQPRDDRGRFSTTDGGAGFAEVAQQAIDSALGGESPTLGRRGTRLSEQDSERLTQAFADEAHAQGERLAPVFPAASVSFAGGRLFRGITTVDDALLARGWAADLRLSVDGLVRVASDNQPEAARVVEVHFDGAGLPGNWPPSAAMGTIAYVEGRSPGGDFSDEWVLKASPEMDFRINVTLGMERQIEQGVDTGWFMRGLDYAGISAHEFGHLFHASGDGLTAWKHMQDDKVASTTFGFIRAEANGVRVSQYAYKNREEQWAELFASKYVLPKDEQPPVVADGRLDRFIASLHETSLAPSRAVRYSEDQPRVPAGSPEGGEFTANGTAGDLIEDLSPAKRAKVAAQMDALRSQFPALRGVRVVMVDADPQGRMDVLAYADQNTQTINLIRSAWSVRNPGGARGSEWNAVPGIEGTIAHEVGHIVAGHLASPGPGVKYDIAANDLMERLNARDQKDWVSSYGSMGDPGENWAEWFSAAMVAGNRKYDAPQAVEIRAALADAGFYKPPASRSPARYWMGDDSASRAAEWDPSLHPRDNAGKFADAGGGLNTVSPEWMKRYDAPLRALSDGEQHALDYYGTFKYSLVNGYLRNGVVPDRWVLFNGFERATEDADRRRVPEIVGQIHGAIEQMPPTDRDVTVVRQFNARQFGHIEDGDVVVDKGFVSTAIDPAHAKSAAPGDLPALAYITLPKGTRASPIDIFGPTELVLDYGALFRVDHVDRDKSGYPTRWLMTYTGSNPEQQGSAPMATRQPPSTQAGRFLWGSGDLIVTSPVARVPSVLRYPGQPRDEYGQWATQGGTILDPLRAEAAKYPTFDAFSRAYQVEIKHGLYWHVTADKDFVVDPTKGPRDMSSAATGGTSPGELMVTSDLARWLAEYPSEDRPYVARIDLSAVAPEDYRSVSRGFGNEFIVSDPGKAEVVGTYSRNRAKAIDREYDAALPQNEEQLRAVWEVAHKITPPRSRYPGQPRDEKGQFASGYQGDLFDPDRPVDHGPNPNAPEIRVAASTWSNGWASEMRSVLLAGGGDQASYGGTYAGRHNLLEEAMVLVHGVNDSPPIQYRLFRGLGMMGFDFIKFGQEVDVGKTIDLNLSAWTRAKDVATQFASNSFGTAVGFDEYGTPLMCPHQVIFRLEPGAHALDITYDIVQGPEYTEHLSLGRYEVVAIQRTEGSGQMSHDGSYQTDGRYTRDIVTLKQVGTLDESNLLNSNARKVAPVVGRARLIPWLEKLLDARMVPPDPGDRGPEKRVVDAHGNVHDDLGRFSEKGGYGADPFGGRSDAAMGRVEYARTLEIAKAARAWPDTQPWNATRDDIAAGRVPFFVVKDLSPGTIAMAALGEIWVNVDQWDQREPKERAVVLYHELGHFALASAEIEPAISAEIIGLSGRTPLPASAWGSLAGSIDPVGETLADIYADVATSEPGIDQDGSGVKVPGLPGRWVTDERAVKLWATVESEARFNGFPGGTQVLLWPRQQLPDRATRVVDALGNVHDELGRFSEKGGAASGPDFWYPWSEDHDWAKGHEVGDFPATAYARHVGFDAPSHSATTEEMDRLIAGGAKAMYRGVDNERYLAVLHDGFYRASFGIYGSGIYTTTSRSEAAGYGSRFSQESWVARMTLAPDARVIVHADLRREMEGARVAFDAETAANDHLNDFEKKIYKVDTLDEYRAAEKDPTGYQSGRDKIRDVVFANEGIFAMAHGYDAIDLSENARTSMRDRADLSPSTPYTIVLNRGALVVEETAAHYKAGKVVDGPNWRSVRPARYPGQPRDEKGQFASDGDEAGERPEGMGHTLYRKGIYSEWGSTHGGSSAITGHSATVMGIPGYYDAVVQGTDDEHNWVPNAALKSVATGMVGAIAADKIGAEEPLYHGFADTSGATYKPGDTMDLPLLAAASEPDVISYGTAWKGWDEDAVPVGTPTLLEFPRGTPMVGYSRTESAYQDEQGIWSEAIVAGRFRVSAVRDGILGSDDMFVGPQGWRDEGRAYRVVTLEPTHVFDIASKEWTPVETSLSGTPNPYPPRTWGEYLRRGNEEIVAAGYKPQHIWDEAKGIWAWNYGDYPQ